MSTAFFINSKHANTIKYNGCIHPITNETNKATAMSKTIADTNIANGFL